MAYSDNRQTAEPAVDDLGEADGARVHHRLAT
jgi:hypothetical protein